MYTNKIKRGREKIGPTLTSCKSDRSKRGLEEITTVKQLRRGINNKGYTVAGGVLLIKKRRRRRRKNECYGYIHGCLDQRVELVQEYGIERQRGRCAVRSQGLFCALDSQTLDLARHLWFGGQHRRQRPILVLSGCIGPRVSEAAACMLA